MNRTEHARQLATAAGIAMLFALTTAGGCARPDDPAPTAQDAADETRTIASSRTVEAACGECQFGMEGDSCDLAVRIDGVGYFVDGSGLDDHGDAHAPDGLCNAIRQAKVVGRVEGGRFHAESFELIQP
ncbi:MAG: DUF6370 family protein [Phycisphaerales bacterium JB041]